MDAQELIHDLGDLGDAIFRHEPREPLRQLVFFEGGLDEIAIEDCPGSLIVGWCMELEVGGEFLGDAMGAGAGLAGNGDGQFGGAVVGGEDWPAASL